ncbi:MAG: type I methionyl aminopeptidase [Patescibacteria group bacterium]|nr:type I methionyl aminopeptidase [Patescibacteria group bacterium]
MIIIKTDNEINIIREGGKILANILDQVIKKAKPGVNIRDLDQMAEKMILQNNGVPSFKNYKQKKSDPPFPSTMCISINEEVVHGDGTRDIKLVEGDIVDFDIGMRYPANNGLYTDMSKTVGIGKIPEQVKKLIEVTKKSLELGIKQIKPGNKIVDIERAIQNYAEQHNFSVVRSLTGHGVGKAVHEEPMIPNYIENHFGKIELKKGMVIAIEPMVNIGGYEVKFFPNEWAVVTADKSLSAHFEHTIAVVENGYQILTI